MLHIGVFSSGQAQHLVAKLYCTTTLLMVAAGAVQRREGLAMSKRRWITGTLIVACLLCTGYLFGQESSTDNASTPKITGGETLDSLSTAELRFELAMSKANLALMTGKKVDAAEARESADAVTDILVNAPTDPKMVRALVGKSLWQFYAAKADARGAVQVSQAANEASQRLSLLQVEQNQRIIELLEQVAKKGTVAK
jgi:hypothetical protein